MIKWCYEYQSYWCHYGARTSTLTFDTKEEAQKANAKDFYLNDDGYVSGVYKKVIITPAEKALHERRVKAREIKVFDYKKDSDAYGIITFWDGSKDAFFVIDYQIYFLRSKEIYPFWQYESDDSCKLKYIKKLRVSIYPF